MGLVGYVVNASIIIFVALAYRRAVATLVEERELRLLVADEMRHRMRNMGAIIQSAIRISLGPESEMTRLLSKRIDALLATNDHHPHDTAPIGLADILSDEVAAYPLGQFSITGPAVILPPKLAMIASMVFHELAVNAAKYGALSHAGGRVTVSWQLNARSVDVTWIESTLQTDSSARNKKGSGTTFMDRVLRTIGGEIFIDLDRNGLHCKFTLPKLD